MKIWFLIHHLFKISYFILVLIKRRSRFPIFGHSWFLLFRTVKTISTIQIYFNAHIHHSFPCTSRYHLLMNDLTNQFISEWECLPQIFALGAFKASICSEPLVSMLVNKIFTTYVDSVKGKFSKRKCNHLTLFTFLFLSFCVLECSQ